MMGKLKNAFSKSAYEDLCCAVWDNDPETVRKLLGRGMDTAHAPGDEAPLFVNAVQRDYTEVAAAFLDAGADPNGFRDKAGRYLLQIAVMNRNHALSEKLLEHGANPNILLDDGYSLMHHVVSMMGPDMTRIMLEHGARTDVTAEGGQTVMSYASDQAKQAICEFVGLKAAERTHKIHHRIRRRGLMGGMT